VVVDNLRIIIHHHHGKNPLPAATPFRSSLPRLDQLSALGRTLLTSKGHLFVPLYPPQEMMPRLSVLLLALLAFLQVRMSTFRFRLPLPLPLSFLLCVCMEAPPSPAPKARVDKC